MHRPLKPNRLSYSLVFAFAIHWGVGCGPDDTQSRVSGAARTPDSVPAVRSGMLDACNGTSDNFSLNNGTITSAYPNVVLLTLETSSVTGICTATKISSNKLLTAAHCTKINGRPVTIQAHEINCSEQDVTSYVVTNVNSRTNEPLGDIDPESFDPEVISNDIAVLEVDSADWTSYTRLAANAPSVGDQTLIVGYGETSPVGADPAGESGKKRFANHTLTQADPALPLVSAGMIASYARSDGKYISHGDSGGPLLKGGEIVGVASVGGVHNDGGYIMIWVDVNDSSVSQWIDGAL